VTGTLLATGGAPRTDLVGTLGDWAVRITGLSGWKSGLAYLGAMVVVAALLLAFVALFAGPVTWVERRVAGRMQSRIGPNRVGPHGFLQWLADGLKNLLKEDLVPREADPVLFRLAPYFVWAGMFGTFAVLPFSAAWIAADASIGILYVMAITALVVVGLIMGGWASNSKWSLLGGMRSAAQIVSYEIPTALAILCPVLVAGSLSTQDIIRAQGGWPWQWIAFHDPFCLAALVVFFIASLAEGNRTPFDIPEAESELVSGYNTEYSGFRFLAFLFAEWANLWIMGAVATLAFLGGWQLPGVPADVQAASILLNVAGMAVFVGKTSVLVLVIIHLRWTLPRIRVDQMMNICWKYLVPISFVCLLGAAGWMLVARKLPRAGVAASVALSIAGAALVLSLFVRARWNRLRMGAAAYWKQLT